MLKSRVVAAFVLLGQPEISGWSIFVGIIRWW